MFKVLIDSVLYVTTPMRTGQALSAPGREFLQGSLRT